MAERPLSYHALRKILRSFGIKEDKRRGKGSERMFVGIVNGKITKYPTKYHGDNTEKPKAVIRAIRRAFGLREDDGVDDEDFYSRA